jgi:hypothetical protein
MAKFVRVNMPVDKPQDTFKLAKEAIEWNTELGAGTVLTGYVDMAVFESKVTAAETKQKDGDKKANTAQKKFLRAAKACGLAKGQNSDTEGTIHWYVLQIRDILLGKNHGTEEDLSEFGFNVVISSTGARRNIRVDIPVTPADMITLAKAIIEEHEELDVDSPLNDEPDMAVFTTLVTDADALMTEWAAAKANAQVLHGQALHALGYAEGQTSDTEGTIYYDLCAIRDRLLQKHKGTEEDLSDYGFEVVISEASTGKKKATGKITIELIVLMGQTAVFDLEGKDISPYQTATFLAVNQPGLAYASASEDGFPGPVPGYPLITGVPVVKETAEVITDLGLGDAKPFLKVQNNGVGPGTYRLTME